MMRANIKGAEREFADAVSHLEAARPSGFEIPALCSDRRLQAVGACLLCLVESAGERYWIAACLRKIADGTEIETHAPKIRYARAINLRMLARNYPPEAFRKFPDKPFHQLAQKYGLTKTDFGANSNDRRIDDSHIFTSVDIRAVKSCGADVELVKF
jgi:predicted molibdopterin-dependent oxidoreductase YjgC